MTAQHAFTCSCGAANAHIIMRRRTADGFEINLWENGAVTGVLGIGFRGVPVRRPKSPEAIAEAKKAGALLLGEVCLYDADELPVVYEAATRAARIDNMPGTLRRLLRKRRARQGRVALRWTVTEADRDGAPRERVCRLPRLRWPGLVVFDFCGGPGSRRGRYRLFRTTLAAPDTATDTGLAFRTLDDLWRHLESL